MSLRAKLHLKKESQSNLAPALQQLRQSGELLDVTLVSDDGTAVEAHRLVLSASSPVFRAMLGRHSQTQAIVFLPGTSSSHLTSILDFLYTALGRQLFNMSRSQTSLDWLRNSVSRI